MLGVQASVAGMNRDKGPKVSYFTLDGTGQSIGSISMVGHYDLITSGLQVHLQSAKASSGTSQGTNSPQVSTFYNLANSSSNGTLTNFGYTASSGWLPQGTDRLPISLSTDTDGETDIVVGNVWESQSLQDDLTLVTDPAGGGAVAVKFYMDRSKTYTPVADGNPRCEISGSSKAYSPHTTQTINFKTYLPEGHTFENGGYQQRQCFWQLHQDPYAMRLIGFDGSNYYVEGQGLSATSIGSASGDLGSWVSWRIELDLDHVAGQGSFVVYKNDVQVHSDTASNVQDNANLIYSKFGVYHWDWKNYTSAQSTMSLYMKDISITGNVTHAFDIADYMTKLPYSLYFDGTNDYVSVATNATLNTINTDFTIEAWVKGLRKGTTEHIVNKCLVVGNSKGFGLLLRSTQPYVRLWAYDTALRSTSTNQTDIRDGGWHHVVGIKEGNTFKLYIDNVKTADENVTVGDITNTNNIRVGTDPNTATPQNFFKGELPIVRVYNTAFTASQVNTNFHLGLIY